MSGDQQQSVEEVLLTRRGLVFLPEGGGTTADALLRAVDLDLANIGYLPSTRLRKQLAALRVEEVCRVRAWCIEKLLKQVGGDQKHTPLFRRFPDGVPDDTLKLWWSKVLVHFLQGTGQPCLFCGKVGTTHVLDPCMHVVCDYCFDGSNYSACPVCERHVDTSSPFFSETSERPLPKERITFKLLDLATNIDDEARQLFVALCERKQALSPQDRNALDVLIQQYKLDVLSWLPETVPLKENIAVVFGGLLRDCNAADVMPHARRYLKTATDVLRLIAVYSGTDGSLQAETVIKQFETTDPPSRFWGHIAKLIGAQPPGLRPRTAYVPLRVHRFKVARLSRALRRELLGMLEAIPPQQLTEDMLRHQSFWVWIGEFLHPHEYAKRFPRAAEAFHIVRKQGPDGSPAPLFRTWYSQVEHAMAGRDVDELVRILSQRPGEFGRRLDHAMRSAGSDEGRVKIVSAFTKLIPDLPTPMLATLHAHLPSRTSKAPVRIYWPKGKIAKGVSTEDARGVLEVKSVTPIVEAIGDELRSRFSKKASYDTCLIDAKLKDIMVPFNERTATKSAVSLPRGSRMPVDLGKTARLFLHWLQPEQGGRTTDLDLSIAFYDADWQYRGVCSYYELKLNHNGSLVAQSGGDLQDAPWPDGATEFVDIHTSAAAAMGARYAVMVINSYAGMPFSMLERGFAGLMLRDDAGGQHFDPRTVELKFALDGENGVYLPLVLDLDKRILHWLDVQSKGQFEMNNVATSNADISRLCPELMTYFASGVRPSMYELGMLHASSRCRRVLIRDTAITEHIRQDNETSADFHHRLMQTTGDRVEGVSLSETPVLGLLFSGDVMLPEGSEVYALFRERLTVNMSASDFLS